MATEIIGYREITTCEGQYYPAKDQGKCNCSITDKCPSQYFCNQQINGLTDWSPCFDSTCCNNNLIRPCKPQVICCTPGTCIPIDNNYSPPTAIWITNEDASPQTKDKTLNGVCTPQAKSRLKGCAYSIDTFTKGDPITNQNNVRLFIEVFITNPNISAKARALSQRELDTKLYPIYCMQNVSTCQPYPVTATGACAASGILKTCTRANSIEPKDEICRNWYRNTDPSLKDFITTAADKHCILNPDNKCNLDCLCYNRDVSDGKVIGIDQSYVRISNAIKGAALPTDNSLCWYTPCRDPAKFLIPARSVNDGCDANICIAVNNFLVSQAGNVNIDIDTAQTCGNIPTDNGGSSSSTSFWARYGIWFLVGGGIILVAAILFAIIGVVMGKRKNEPKKVDVEQQNPMPQEQNENIMIQEQIPQETQK